MKFDIWQEICVFSLVDIEERLFYISTEERESASIIKHYFNHSHHPYIMLNYAEEKTNGSHTDRKFYVQKNGCLNLKCGNLFRK